LTAKSNKCPLPSRHYSGHCKATEKNSDPGIPGKVIWRKKYGRHACEGRWRQHHKTELDEDKWSVAYAPLGAV